MIQHLQPSHEIYNCMQGIIHGSYQTNFYDTFNDTCNLMQGIICGPYQTNFYDTFNRAAIWQLTIIE